MKIQKLFNRENFIRCKSFLLLAVFVLCALFIRLCDAGYCGQLSTQQLASRWSKSGKYVQLSVFFEKGYGLSEGELYPLRSRLRDACDEAASDVEGEGRKVVDAYAKEGELFISSKQTKTSVRAYGVSKDFFLFHPLELLSGTYFTPEDDLEDGIILDDLTAWKLFGAMDVAGMPVEIGGRTYPVRGVVRSDSGHFSKSSGESEAVVFVDFAMLAREMGDDYPQIDSYELLIVNPVKNFGKTKLSEAIGLSEERYELVDNTNRFDFLSRAARLAKFGTRGMKNSLMVYPYWENRAKGYEDVADLLMAIQLLLWMYPLIFCIVLLVKLIKWMKLKKRLYKEKNNAGILEKILVKWRQKQLKKKHAKE